VRLQTDIEVENDLVEPAASTFFKVSMIRASYPNSTEFSVRSSGWTLRSRSTMPK
jgi:hypothetical protein